MHYKVEDYFEYGKTIFKIVQSLQDAHIRFNTHNIREMLQDWTFMRPTYYKKRFQNVDNGVFILNEKTVMLEGIFFAMDDQFIHFDSEELAQAWQIFVDALQSVAAAFQQQDAEIRRWTSGSIDTKDSSVLPFYYIVFKYKLFYIYFHQVDYFHDYVPCGRVRIYYDSYEEPSTLID